MPAVLLGQNAYKRQSSHLPEIKLKNRYLEKDPANQVDGVALMPRPALVPFVQPIGPGPTRALFRESGCFDGDLLQVSGEKLYRVTTFGEATPLGDVNVSTERAEIASDGVNALVADGFLYLTDGITTTVVATPDDVEIVSVAMINGYFVLQVADVGKFLWLQPTITTIDALDFATAERWPDKGIAVRSTVDELWFLNEQSTEVWVTTGDSDLPFQRVQGRLFEWGCSARATAVNLDNTIFWVGERSQEGRAVLRGGAVPEVVSTNGIAERLNGATDLSATTFAIDGHEFYCLRIGGVGTYAYDVSTGTWSEFSSYGREQWRVQCAAAAPNGPLLLGDDETGQLWTLDPTIGDDDGEPIIRQVTGFIPLVGNRTAVAAISLQSAVGWSPDEALEPVIELRTSRDGFTFNAPRERSLGAQGRYEQRVRWDACGEVVPPGLVLELTDSDACQTRLSYCRFNEPY